MVDEELPAYSAPLDPRLRLTEEEHLQALQKWAEEKKHVRPGDDGTLPAGPGGLTSLALGGLKTTHSEYKGQLPPPSYETATQRDTSSQDGDPSPVRRWLDKRREKKEERRMSKEAVSME